MAAGLEAADAGNAVRRHLSRSSNCLQVGTMRMDLERFEQIVLLSIGKAAVAMAAAAEQVLGESLDTGLVVTKHGHVTHSLGNCAVIQAGHPIPDEAGERASRLIEALTRQLTASDLLLVLISGGASALMPASASGVTLAAKQQTTNLLLRAGATIYELNAVRKHLSALKGGRLAALAFPATVIGLLLSDVVGDPVDVIGSGPTAPDSSTYADALAVLTKFGLLECVPPMVRAHLENGALGLLSETPKPDDAIFAKVKNVVVGSNRLALEAAAKKAIQLGYNALVLSSTIEGETREIASMHAQILREIVTSGNPVPAPACILSGGETTVTIRGEGKGGRNQEFALAAALGSAGLENVSVLSVGTDGTDGPTDAAGALATGATLERASKLGLDAAAHLACNDSYPFFDALGDLIRTGSTGTNVMDLHILMAG